MEKAVWDAYHTRVFCDICMDEVNANNRDGGCLSRKGYKNLGEKFTEKTGKQFTKKQFKNKWDALKKDYTGWMELQNATGLGWDPVTKTMDADDEWWKTHLLYRPEHAKFRNGPPANLEQQDVMFKKAHVTGESAAIPGQELGEDKDVPILLDDDGEATKKTTLGKRKACVGEKEKESPFFKAYNTALSSIVSKVDVGSSSSKDDSVPTMKEFLAMVRECGVSEGTDLMFTAAKLAVKREHRELLAAFETPGGRFDYLERTHNELNK
ncbi:L10-interacting MYB domain-containing protein isoform X2 [Lolium perenne]|uniref:L10-interacting MYB domain-containing protein isoform X2 n=1 Tax=Lolium perenne TaxID=4522 RepID=UPI0021F5D939|nr:L10-interacting MYB domain-containing protein-like isoform X2 [Lolium perenne]XP_051207087.1 L10-interacting MYB domain-containing protein-like isoform X2 [Lolium perenne]